jgi:AhpD family alkylhydroperoxidase
MTGKLVPLTPPGSGHNVLSMIEYGDASEAVREVYDDIMATRQTDTVNNFWKALGHQPELLRRTWFGIKEVMGAGALDPLTKELIYLAVSATNQCGYCVASHSAGARAKGMTDQMFGELMAVVGMANQTNALAIGFRVPIDQQFQP